MKTRFRNIRLAALAASVLALVQGCVLLDGYEVDWYPVNVFIKIQDGSGRDLLDPENPDNLIDGTTITFKGETYEASRSWYESGNMYQDELQTRTYAARMYGLYLIRDSMLNSLTTNGFSLIFGEIDGGEDMDEDILVHLANGAEHTIHYHCSKHREGRNPSCKRNWKLDGEKVSSGSFTFTR